MPVVYLVDGGGFKQRVSVCCKAREPGKRACLLLSERTRHCADLSSRLTKDASFLIRIL